MQSSAVKLEPFLLMVKSAKGAGAAKLVEDATAAPGVFVFAELLESPNIHQLAATHASTLSLLRLFSYGTYSDYKSSEASFPKLRPAQLMKLKQLSIVSLASSRRILPYTTLLTYLDIGSIRELEDLIIDAMYQDMLQGKLDQKEQQFEIEYTMGRDLEPGQTEKLLVALNDWSERTAEVLKTIDLKLGDVTSEEAAAKMQVEDHTRARDALVQELQSKSGLSKGRHDDAMDWESSQGRGDSRDEHSRKKKINLSSGAGGSSNIRKRTRG